MPLPFGNHRENLFDEACCYVPGAVFPAPPVLQCASLLLPAQHAASLTVTRLALGEYLIEGCVGLNADASWGGIDGGFEIPQDRNKQPLIWLDYVVNQDGSVLVKTFHRTHDNSPVFARNDIPGVSNGDPIDIPANQFVSVRVQMPEDSAWNKLKEQLNKAELIEDDVVE